ncbi:hypothetical protein [Devosia sp.]|uniref:hypothetical protein n=1 Tax=Devosia sp. TaxID=1871048 RepID=UPI0025C4C9AA|nr:hypothetical protein [Devosia sp.]
MRRALLALAATGCLLAPATAQDAPPSSDAKGCDPFNEAVFASPAAVPDALLAAPQATDCLMGTLATLSQRNAGAQLSPADQGALVRASGALDKLIAGGGMDAINRMRAVDSVGIVDLLSWGATSADYDTRANATNLLTNIIDNTTVCVVMDHLADPTLTTTDDGIKGRANLLATVSVVAPWATKSNYQNMWALSAFLGKQVDAGSAPTTQKLLQNFGARLAFQNSLPPSKANKNFESPGLLQSCQDYTPRWATSGDFVLQYPRQ